LETVAKIKDAIRRVLSFDAVTGGSSRQFVIRCLAWLLIFRFVLALWAIVYPDSKNIASFVDLSITPLVNGKPGNDSWFYWLIATQGYLPTASPPGFQVIGWRLLNFSPLYPAVLSLFIFLFQENTPFVLNTVFVLATAPFLIGFLNKVVKNQRTARFVAILILFNPIFQGYAIFGLTEPLYFLLIFATLDVHYKAGLKYRILECCLLVLIVLNRFIGFVFAVFYVYKALFARGKRLFQRIALLVPAGVLGATYATWDLVTLVLLGHTPSEARAHYWGDFINLNPLAPSFALQAPLLLAGAALGLLVLLATLSKHVEAIKFEEERFSRIDVQALVAYAAATIFFLGLFSKQISLLRYTGTLFPLLMVLAFAIPTGKLIRLASFLIAWGVSMANVYIFATGSSYQIQLGYIPTIDGVLGTIMAGIFLALSMMLFIKRKGIRHQDALVALQFIFGILLIPIVIAFP
jgi:hypothetical protein